MGPGSGGAFGEWLVYVGFLGGFDVFVFAEKDGVWFGA